MKRLHLPCRLAFVSVSLSSVLALGCGGDDATSGGATEDGSGTAGSSSGMAMTTAAMTTMSADDSGSQGGSDGSTGTPPADSSGDDSGSSGAPADSSGSGDDGSSSGGSSDSGDAGESSSSDGGNNMDSGTELCLAPGNLVPCDDFDAAPTVFNAIGLACAGGPDSAIPITGEGFNWSDPESWAVIRQYGSHIDGVTGEPIWGAREGDTMLLLSSGYGGIPNAAGVITNDSLFNDSNDNPDNKPMPAPMTAQTGSGAAPFVGCDGVGDCSDSLAAQWAAGGNAANDLIWLQFASQVPGGTHGFSIDFAYFSEEFPEWVGTTFNDMFVVWSNSETYTGNLCFVDDQPCTVTALWPTQYQNNQPPELSGTGFSFDGATGWFQIKGSAEPLELLQLSFAVFDMGDTGWDTMVLIDNFQWDCEGCTPTEVNPCGVVDPV
jgi:hypothetical protein